MTSMQCPQTAREPVWHLENETSCEDSTRTEVREPWSWAAAGLPWLVFLSFSSILAKTFINVHFPISPAAEAVGLPLTRPSSFRMGVSSMDEGTEGSCFPVGKL